MAASLLLPSPPCTTRKKDQISREAHCRANNVLHALVVSPNKSYNIKLYKVPSKVRSKLWAIRCFATKSSTGLQGIQKESDIFSAVSSPNNFARNREGPEMVVPWWYMVKEGSEIHLWEMVGGVGGAYH